MFFTMSQDAIDALCRKDKRMAQAIAQIGSVERTITPDFFTALMHSIIGQQISTKAQATICARVDALLGNITPAAVAHAAEAALQGCGLSYRKVFYMQNAARAVLDGTLDLAALAQLPDDEICRTLSALPGIGVWTAEMLMLFSMQRQNIFSYGDLGIHRGLRMLYRHKTIDKKRFEAYRRRFAPYGSIASIYLWAISSGALPQLTDPAALFGQNGAK